MKRLTITNEEINNLEEYIKNKFVDACKNDIEKFEIKKEDVKKQLSTIDDSKIVKPILNITSDAYVKMFQCVDQSEVEISWHGMVLRNENEYTVYDILMFPQINSGVSTTTDDDEFADWQLQLIENPEFPLEDLRLHGHSHVNMGVYSSGIDDQYQSDLIRKIEPGDYYIFMILNKKREMCIFIYDYAQNILFETNDITVQILSPTGMDIITEVTALIKENCKEETPKCHGFHSSYWGDSSDYYGYYAKSGGFSGRGVRR